MKTATEVSSDNSALMRNIARHEHSLEASLVGISHALLHMVRTFGDSLPDEGEVRVQFDDSIIADTYAEKAQDMREVGVTMVPWEYRVRWYGESESVAKERAVAWEPRHPRDARAFWDSVRGLLAPADPLRLMAGS